MTKEELKEAIAATITENGQKGITGQALANLLNEIVDVAGEGGGAIPIDVSEENVPNEANAAAYELIKQGMQNGIGYTITLVNSAEGIALNAQIYSFVDGESLIIGVDMGVLLGATYYIQFWVSPDGSTSIHELQL